jgi:hypothetical protein
MFPRWWFPRSLHLLSYFLVSSFIVFLLFNWDLLLEPGQGGIVDPASLPRTVRKTGGGLFLRAEGFDRERVIQAGKDSMNAAEIPCSSQSLACVGKPARRENKVPCLLPGLSACQPLLFLCPVLGPSCSCCDFCNPLAVGRAEFLVTAAATQLADFGKLFGAEISGSGLAPEAS